MNRESPCIGWIFISFLSAALLACSLTPENTSYNSGEKPAHGCSRNLDLPAVSANSAYEHWHLTVNRLGQKRWNGQDLDRETLRSYMIELSEMPVSAGRLTIHIEPMASCQAILEIQNIVVDSPLCSQHRCIQDRWEYKKPIVN